jgi:hypothetical protein
MTGAVAVGGLAVIVLTVETKFHWFKPGWEILKGDKIRNTSLEGN